MEYKFNKNSKFLVTGGAGFIGSHLCEEILNLGYSVRCLDNLSTGNINNIKHLLNNKKFEFIEGDITNLDTCMNACKGIDYVLHEAAWGSVNRSIEMPVFYCNNNIIGTVNMLEAARKNNVKKFVYASSSSVYGDNTDSLKKEGNEGNLLSIYALTKRCDEELAKQYSMHYKLDTIGLRYFNAFGPRQNTNGAYAAVIPKFITQLINNETPHINGDGSQSRDFTYIDNVVKANILACLSDSKYSGNVFNVACNDSIKLIDLYNLICNILNKNIEPDYKERRIGDIKFSRANIENITNKLNYNDIVYFEEGIKKTINWYINHHNKDGDIYG